MKKLKYNLIGLSGNLGNGKDLIGNIINYLSHHNSGYEEREQMRIEEDMSLIDAIMFMSNPHIHTTYTIKKYADALKDICCIILGCTREQLEDREYKETPIPHLTKYKVDYNYEIPLKSMSKYNPMSGSKIFPTLESAEEFINKGVLGECIIISHELTTIYTTPRDIQNLFGTTCGRDMIHPNIWCEALFSKYHGHKMKTFTSDKLLDRYMHTSCHYCNKPYAGYKRQWYCNSCADEIGQIFPNWLITDVRFPDNEGKYIKDRGGIVIGVKRKFSLRFPEYAHLEDTNDPYKVPSTLEKVDPTLYKRITSSSEVSMGDFSWCDVIIENNGSIEELVDKVKEIIWI